MINSQPVAEHRTQVYFPQDLFKEIKKVSQKQEISIAEIIRRAVRKEVGKEELLKEKQKKSHKIWKKFFSSAGMGCGPKDLSYKHDQYFNHQ